MDGPHRVGQSVSDIRAATPVPSSGILFILIAATGFGLLPVLTRAADSLGIPIETMLVARFVGPAVIFLPWLARAAGEPRRAAILFATGVVMGAGVFGYLNALIELEVATAALIFFTFPLFTILLGFLLAGIRPSTRELIAVAMILGATALILQPRSVGTAGLTTILFAFAAPAAYGLLILTLANVGGNLGIRARTAPVALGSLVGALPYLLVAETPQDLTFNTDVFLVLAAQLTIAGLIPQISLVVGTRRTGPALAAIVATAELVVALTSGWFVLGERIKPASVLGAAAIVGAIILAAWPNKTE